MQNNDILILNRRRTLRLMGAAGAAVLFGTPRKDTLANAADAICVVAPQATEGPYWVDEMLNRSDIRVDPSDGSIRPGVPLTLSINVHESSSAGCSPLPGAHVDVWHCDALGSYSDEAVQNTVGKKFLRGYQISDDNGAVQFTTVYPGWYSGRTVHIHVRIRTYSGSQVYDEFVSQLFFDDTITDQAFTQSPYSQRRSRDTRNSNDMVLQGMANSSLMFLNLSKTDQGYTGSIDIGVSLRTTAATRPVVSAGGIVNAASYLPGIAPGAWIAIFGQGLASANRTATAADVSNGALPTAFGGVSVQINNRPAFVNYVSPTQINVQAPADTSLGTVQVAVTNSAGTSNAVAATLQGIFPGFFTTANYIAAVRSDGVVVGPGSAVVAAKSGDVLQLYGTGFGPTSPTVNPGAVFQGSAPLSNPVTVSIGGVAAIVSYAGLVAAGLNQFNVTVPALADGDYEVVAEIAGLRTQSGVLLKVRN